MPGKPRLRRGVRLTFDKVRDTHVLLFPEGVLVPNATAAAVLELCDGASDVDQIAARLGTRFRGVRAEDVTDVLARFEDRRVVEWT
ncbi:pyrroloquinoline quinone biosynthesis protein PqqD [Actinophytocola xinjiangensis]|jgi:pyrroloquinoline quinone biosynthesis protein D|uniref:Pyrroloquinoline quinone biosynthesis protein PqqD n=1 Tax=Actinophytocola xinjiangensis TaxID=485602 RepID=A0A7Z0WRT5_9PSEU|nr:pyrroloquinoline quinone biosynthesis peptide chaperone PqqD [Actinophytocola xinjiangensis]OLF13693.1 pyrroloquinoline quinone biosynthesis protein PqqD [Actinophytocola xinjiangensis]